LEPALTSFACFLYWIFMFSIWDRNRERIAYYTIDGHYLAPYPNMTDEDLQDYEDWAVSEGFLKSKNRTVFK